MNQHEQEPHFLEGKFEPEARNAMSSNEAAMISIAVSLKRIADGMAAMPIMVEQAIWKVAHHP